MTLADISKTLGYAPFIYSDESDSVKWAISAHKEFVNALESLNIEILSNHVCFTNGYSAYIQIAKFNEFRISDHSNGHYQTKFTNNIRNVAETLLEIESVYYPERFVDIPYIKEFAIREDVIVPTNSTIISERLSKRGNVIYTFSVPVYASKKVRI